jgi:hypothetical protein
MQIYIPRARFEVATFPPLHFIGVGTLAMRLYTILSPCTYLY